MTKGMNLHLLVAYEWRDYDAISYGSDPFSSARKSRSLANEILLRQEWQNRITRPPRLVNKISKNGNVFWAASEIRSELSGISPAAVSSVDGGSCANLTRRLYLDDFYWGGEGFFSLRRSRERRDIAPR